MAVLALFACAFQAHGTDTYDIASHQLQTPTLRIGSATYSNVVLTIGSIITPPSGTSPNGTDDSYNPNNNELTVLAVKVGSTTYYNAVTTVAALKSIGSVIGADTFDGTHLNIPYLQVGPTIYHTVVLAVGLSNVAKVNGGMPSISLDQFNAVAGQLTIPAVQIGSTVYTNVVLNVGPGNVVSVGGATGQWSSTFSVGTGVYPLLARDPSDSAFVLAWCANYCTSPSDTNKASRYTDAAGWGAAADIGPHATLNGMGFDAQGRGFAVWATGDSIGQEQAGFSRYVPASGWTQLYMPFAVQLPPEIVPPGSLLWQSVAPLGLSVFPDGTATAPMQADQRVYNSAGGPSGQSVTYWDDFIAQAGNSGSMGVDVLAIGGADLAITPTTPTPVMAPDGNGGTFTYLPLQLVFSSVKSVQAPTAHSVGATYNYETHAHITLGNGSAGLSTIQLHNAIAWNGGIGASTTFDTDDITFGVYHVFFNSQGGLAVADDGGALVVWAQVYDNRQTMTIMAQRFDGRAWHAARQLYSSTGLVPDYSFQLTKPVVTLDGQGRGIVVAQVLDKLMMFKYDPKSDTFGSAAPISTESPGNSLGKLLADFQGNAYLIDGSFRVRRYDVATNTWTAPALVAGTNGIPSMALDRNGLPMVAWQSGGGAGNTIYASRFK